MAHPTLPLPFRYLTNKGTEYLRTYLHLPAEIVPSTYKRTQRSETARVRPTTARVGGAKPQGDRADYRHASGPSGAPDKKGDVGPGATEFEFVSVRFWINWRVHSNPSLSLAARWIRSWSQAPTTIDL